MFWKLLQWNIRVFERLGRENQRELRFRFDAGTLKPRHSDGGHFYLRDSTPRKVICLRRCTLSNGLEFCTDFDYGIKYSCKKFEAYYNPVSMSFEHDTSYKMAANFALKIWLLSVYKSHLMLFYWVVQVWMLYLLCTMFDLALILMVNRKISTLLNIEVPCSTNIVEIDLIVYTTGTE